MASPEETIGLNPLQYPEYAFEDLVHNLQIESFMTDLEMLNEGCLFSRNQLKDCWLYFVGKAYKGFVDNSDLGEEDLEAARLWWKRTRELVSSI